MASLLAKLEREVHLQSGGRRPPTESVRVSGGESSKGPKTSTILIAIAVAVIVVSSVVVAVVVINRQAEQTHNSNLVRIEDDDEDWKDLSDYPEMLEKSKRMRQNRDRKNQEPESVPSSEDPNFTLLEELE